MNAEVEGTLPEPKKGKGKGKGGKAKGKRKPTNSKYERRFCKMLIDFFDIPPVNHENVTVVTRGGNAKTYPKDVAAPLPHFSEFARQIGVSLGTMQKWRETYPEFKEAHDRAFELQKKMFVNNTLAGHYNPIAARLFAHHMFNIREARDNNVTGNIQVNVSDYSKADIPGLPPLIPQKEAHK